MTQPYAPGGANDAPPAAQASDPHRPIYHFLPINNWMNDPNGVIKWRGQYHMFFQYNPNGAMHGTIHWGHAVSSDLVHWSYLPIALAPTPGTVDEDGCWSGCALDNNGTPTLMYTGLQGRTQRPCLATSRDDMLTWEKYAGNPVIAEPPSDLDVLGFRDHCVWRENGDWYQIIGSGIRDVGGTVLLYRSPNLIEWEYLGPLCVGDGQQTEPVATGTMWECPQLLRWGELAALIISVHIERPCYTIYLLGSYENHRFTPHVVRKLDFGDRHFYAPQALLDDDGRVIMWGWLHEGRRSEAWQAAGWSGVMSLPRVVTPRANGYLGFAPAPELEALRGEHTRIAACRVGGNAPDPLAAFAGDALELYVEMTSEGTAPFGVGVRCSPDNEEHTIIGYDPQAAQLFIDRRQASRDPHTTRDVQSGSLALQPGESLQLRIFLDRSVVEVFANERACLTSRIYPQRPDSLGLRTCCLGGVVALQRADVWQMQPARFASL